MEKQEKIKIICDQLKGLFESLDKKTNYRSEIINDYHKIILNLTGLLTLNNLEDYQIPLSALETGPFISPFEEKYYNGAIVRSKIKQLISVLESEYQIIEKTKKQLKPNLKTEITLTYLVNKELSNLLINIKKHIPKIEENSITKILILIGGIGGGIAILINIYFKFYGK